MLLYSLSGEGYFGIKSGDIVIAGNDGRFGEMNVTRFVLPADGSVSFDDFRSLSPTLATWGQKQCQKQCENQCQESLGTTGDEKGRE